MRVAITGSTGLIGGALAARLEGAGHEVLRIRRGSEDDPSADWDPAGGWIRGGAFAGHDAIVNLSGANIGGGRWSAARRAELRSSRIQRVDEFVRNPGGDLAHVILLGNEAV